MKRIACLTALLLAGALAQAKIPAPPMTDEAKAKAAEAAARTAYNARVDNYKLCLTMDKVAARYFAEAKGAGKDVKPGSAPACADPGPFVYAAPNAKPLEAAGAHSPPATATSPPSTKTPSAEQAPAKK